MVLHYQKEAEKINYYQQPNHCPLDFRGGMIYI